MGLLFLWFIPFILFSFSQHDHFAYSSVPQNHLCPSDQQLALFQFQQNFTIDASASADCDSDRTVSYPKTLSWNRTTDCCTWDGIECDSFTGNVIGLDLSCSQLHGTFHSNTSLFQLSHLRRLNLGHNDFSLSRISRKIGGFASMTHLNLSSTRFSGSIPSEISHLSKLVSLDLSLNFEGVTLSPRSFKLLVQNLTWIQTLILTSVEIPSVLPVNMSSSLRNLVLVSTGLHGKIPGSILKLPNLKTLDLASNMNLLGTFPEIDANFSSPLEMLSLSGASLSGELPHSIGHLNALKYLDISSCQFSGRVPESLGNLTQITDLTLFSNLFSGQLPSNIRNLGQLTQIDVSYNDFEGEITDFFGNLGKLKDLMLAFNSFSGFFPTLAANLTQLESLDLSNNSFSGPLPLMSNGFQNLILLLLPDNSFDGMVPSWLFSLPSLKFLSLRSNRLEGRIYEFQYQSLTLVDLSDNKLLGAVPKSISNLVDLVTLDLSSNNFSGRLDLGMFSNLQALRRLGLSNNRLSVSAVNATFSSSLGSLLLAACEITELDILRPLKRIATLDLSKNKISGQFPDWAASAWGDTLFYLNLSHNFLTGLSRYPFPQIVYLDLRSNLLEGTIPVLPLTAFLFISHNHITGEIPSSICNLKSLSILDLSYNSLSGVIPKCLGTRSTQLSVLNLEMNSFQGTIPRFAKGLKLRNLNVNGNQLKGEVPRSIANCRLLEVLDLGNNQMNSTFPHWLATLPQLQVLVLKSNKFFGPMISNPSVKYPFPKLRIIDISHNRLTGFLPETYFKNFKAMMNMDRIESRAVYMEDRMYQDSVTVVVKGQEIELVRILTIFTTVDLSSNNFEGELPNVIGNLNSLRVLNFSHNSFQGQIPPTLGSISVLESLDLSSNQLVGEIPQQIAGLTFLSVLNLSQNHLVGRIPRGPQFNTFLNDSFGGNPGLCGFPLSKNCGGDETPQPPEFKLGDDSDSGSGFIWKVGMMGYGSGTLAGLVSAYLMLATGKPKWFAEFVEAEKHRIVRRRRKTYHIDFLKKKRMTSR